MATAVAADVERVDLSDEAIRVRRWRLDQLMDVMKLPEALAAQLADSREDLRRIEKMLEQGCTHEQLARILL